MKITCKPIVQSLNVLFLATLALTLAATKLNAALGGAPSNLPYTLSERGSFYRVW